MVRNNQDKIVKEVIFIALAVLVMVGGLYYLGEGFTGLSVAGVVGECDCQGIRYIVLDSDYGFTNGNSYDVKAEVFKGTSTLSSQLMDSEEISFSSLNQVDIDDNPGTSDGNLIIEGIDSGGVRVRLENTSNEKLYRDNTFLITVTDYSQGYPSNDSCKEGKVLICHKPGTPAEHNLCISPFALGGHINHGDYYPGPCDGVTGLTTLFGPETIDLSCSEPIDAGDIFGDFEVYDIDKIMPLGCPLTVVAVEPLNGSVYNISKNITLVASVISPGTVDRVFANITLPDGEVIEVDMPDRTGNLFSGILINENLVQKGEYTLTFYANNTFGERNNSETRHLFRITPEDKIFDVTNVSLNYIGYNVSILENNSGLLTLNITLDNPLITNMVVYDYDETSPRSLIRVETDANDDLFFDHQYVIDVSEANLSSVNVTLTAQGYHLFKCVNFSKETLICNDDEGYEQILTGLTPGEEYTISLTSIDPVFGETIQGAENTSDSYIRQQTPNSNYGGATDIRIGESASLYKAFRGIIWFNLSHILNGTEIESVSLSLYFYNIPGGDDTGNRTHNVHRVQQSPARPWEELEVTWDDYNSTNNWTTPGGDFNATPTNSQTFDSSALGSWISYNVTTDVQDFINNPSTNFGWIIKDINETEDKTQRDYRSSEYGTALLRPKLEIVFDSKNPVVQLISPPNGSTDSDGIILFTYNVTDKNPINHCDLYVDGALLQTDNSITKGVNQTFNQSFANGNYSWYVNCTDNPGNVGMSEVWFFDVKGVRNVSEGVGCCCVLDAFANPPLVSQYETVLITADVSNIFTGEAAFYEDIASVNTTIYRIENGSETIVMDNISMTYLADGLWYYQFDVGNNSAGNYLASVTMWTNQTPAFIREASTGFTVGEIQGSGLTITGVSPDLININQTTRLAAEIKFNGAALGASWITNASLVVEQLNGSVQTYVQGSTLQVDDGLLYVDGDFNETGVYYLDWSATYFNIERTAREIVVVVGWEDLLQDINKSINVELINLIKESRQYLLELLTDMEYLQQFTEEEVFLITDSVNSMSKVVSFLESGEITNEEAEKRFNEIRERLMGQLGDRLTGSVIAEGELEGDSLLGKLSKDWRSVMFVMLLMIFAVMVGVVVLLVKMSRIMTYQTQSPGRQTEIGPRMIMPVRPMPVKKRRYEILMDKLKEKFSGGRGTQPSLGEPQKRRYEIIIEKIKKRIQEKKQNQPNKPENNFGKQKSL
ncbi:MAG: DNRLRE domain-containing protein [Nanoarchaeota archaeon]|nr:DNRLRE domain-containing protein [Nanoarchaeota archaeon]